MYVDLSMFKLEKERYLADINEINASDLAEDIKRIKLDEALARYKNSIRKYLSVAINKINEVTGGNFSLYKIGKDIDANFKVIEGKIRKSKQEIIEEFNLYQSILPTLDDKRKNEFLTALNIVVDYSDDIKVDKDREKFLKN